MWRRRKLSEKIAIVFIVILINPIFLLISPLYMKEWIRVDKALGRYKSPWQTYKGYVLNANRLIDFEC